MIRLNREKVAAGLALVIFALGVHLFFTAQTMRYREIQINLEPFDQGVPPLEPRLHTGDLGGDRNPFHMSSEWMPMPPEPLPPPPLDLRQEFRVVFGSSAARAPGAPVAWRTTPLVEVGEDGQPITRRDAGPAPSPGPIAGVSGIDASFAVASGRPLLCRRTSRLEGVVVTEFGGAKQEEQAVLSEEAEFVDTIEEAAGGRIRASRLLVKAFRERNGEVADPPFNGLRLDFTIDGEQVGLELADAVLPQPMVDELLESASSLGLHLGLPRGAAVGETYAIDLSPLAPLLGSASLTVGSATASMALESFDPATGTATFAGDARIVGQGTARGLVGEETIAGRCVIAVRPSENRILSVRLDGDTSLKGTIAALPGATLTASGRYTVELVTEIGPGVARAVERRPQIRDRAVALAPFGLRFALPSTWAELAEGQAFQYIQSRGPTMGAVLELQALAGDTADPKAFFDQVGAAIKAQSSDLRTEDVSSALGSGRAYIFSATGPAGEALQIRSELYPTGSRYTLIKIQADRRVFPSALKEFEAIKKSIRTLKP